MIIKNGSFGLQRNLNQANERLEKSMGKLSSGKRITSAAVDASGLAISEKLRALQRGSRQALQNVQDAQSLVQTADAAMQELTDVVQRIRELTIQAMNGTNTDVQSNSDSADTLIVQNEIDELKKNLRDIVHNTEFNTHKLLTNTTPGEYVTADRSVSVNRSAQTVQSAGNALTGINTVRSEPKVYVHSEEAKSVSQNVSDSISFTPSSVNVTTVLDHKPQWSADGKNIIFQSSRDGEMYSVHADGSTDPVAAESSMSTAASRKIAGDYRLQIVGSSLHLQKQSGGNWSTAATYSNFNTSDGLQGYNFAPGTDPQGDISFAFSNTDGNISKVVIGKNGHVSSPVTVIPNTDKLNLPPIHNTLSIGGTPDLYRMNEQNASLIVHKVTDSGPQRLLYWDGTGSPPDSGYYTVNGDKITFHREAILGFEPNSEDDAQDYYTASYVRGSGKPFHSESIPGSAQLYNVHGEQGPGSLQIRVGNRTVPKEQFLSERPADAEGTTGVYIDKTTGRAEFYGDLRPAFNETIQIHYIPDNDADRTVQTYVLPDEIDTYNLDSNDPSLPKSLAVYVGSRKLSYDEVDGYTYDPASRRISIRGDGRPDVLNGESLRIEHIKDTSQTTKEVYGIEMKGIKPEVFNLGQAGAPNSIRVFRGNEEIDYSATDGFQYNATTNTIELFGNSRPNVGDQYTVRYVAVDQEPNKLDDKLEIKLSGTPELYDTDSSGYPSTLRVTIGGRAIGYDETKQDGFYYNKQTNTIEVYGNSRPDANDQSMSNPQISVTFVTEAGTTNLYNNSYDIRIPADSSYYGIEEGSDASKGLKVFQGLDEVPYDAENGYTFDADTRTVSLHGSFRPSATSPAGSFKIFSVPESALSRSVPAGSTVHKVFVGGTEIQPAEDDENGDGYIVEQGVVRLVGNARPSAVYNQIRYAMDVLYTEPLTMDLPVNPLLTDDNIYCDHETGTAMPDAEVVPDSQTIGLNGLALSRDQYEISGGRITLINDKVNLSTGSNILSADYQIRQGIHYDDNSYTFQVGGNSGNSKVLNISSFDNMLVDMSAVCVRTAEHAEKGLEIIDRSMGFILGELGNVGAAENSLEHIAANLRVGDESMAAALSRIEDVDVAKELMNSTKLQMLTQVGQTLAGHDKQRHEAVLGLLR